MAVPDYQTLMLPVLRFVQQQGDRELHYTELNEGLARELKLTVEDLSVMLPSGAQTLFSNRVNWARVYLKLGGLVETPRRGFLRITERGREVLATQPARIDRAYLSRFPDFVAHQLRKAQQAAATRRSSQEEIASNDMATPLESLESSYQRLRAELADELLETVKNCTPAFFERLVVELLVKMGYGGSRADAGKALGRTGDEGIDGIIKEDKLGLDAIYIQAKRWRDSSVGRPAIQQFAGALAGQGAHKGIFITTSHFTEDARSFVSKVNSKIVLIDGDELAEFMIDHSVGVATAGTYEVKRVDSDYFSEGED